MLFGLILFANTFWVIRAKVVRKLDTAIGKGWYDEKTITFSASMVIHPVDWHYTADYINIIIKNWIIG